jgi:hypothetical protein
VCYGVRWFLEVYLEGKSEMKLEKSDAVSSGIEMDKYLG